MFWQGLASALRRLIFSFFGSDGCIKTCLLVGKVSPACKGRQELRVGAEGV